MILEALQWANNKLKKTGIDSSMLDAEILLSEVLAVKKTWLFMHSSRQLRSHQEEKFVELINRRSKREPLAYITQTKAFYLKTFHVSPDVLIPRPATETLVELAIKELKDKDKSKTLYCDIGTGSGAIAISIADETKVPVIATDLHLEALSIAKQNVEKHDLKSLVDLKQGNLLIPVINMFEQIHQDPTVVTSQSFPIKHLILCANLPYIPLRKEDTLQPEVQFEPKTALLASENGLSLYKQLLIQTKRFRSLLPKKISLFFEIEPYQATEISNIISKTFPSAQIDLFNDMQKNIRIARIRI